MPTRKKATPKEIYINNYFIEKGILKFITNERDFENISSSTLAFALDPGRVYINLRGKYPSGCIEKEEQYEDIVNEIIQKTSRG